jgi:trehalose 6-phosphate phosphatase
MLGIMSSVGPLRHPLDPAEAIAATAARAGSAAFLFDFDGTLAAIHDDPDSVQPVPGVIEAVSQLAAAVARVAIVSARPVTFLAERFAALPHLDLYGVYGLELRRGAGDPVTDPAVLPWLDAVARATARAGAELPAAVLVEDKRVSVALHYRSAPELAEQVHAWAEARRGDLGLRAQPGRMVVELKPPVPLDKGSVVRVEADGVDCAWYFGDDVSDLAAFRALDEREASYPGFLGVRVAVANPETGAQVAADADIVLAGPDRVPAFLAQVLAGLRRPAA